MTRQESKDHFDVSDVLIGLVLTLATIGVLAMLTVAAAIACVRAVL